MARVVIHYGDDPFEPPSVYVDGDVEVISVCDFAPDDRFYKYTNMAVPEPLSSELRVAEIGFSGDGSEAERDVIDFYFPGYGKLN